MFLNFTFDPKICPNGGVELTTFKDRLSKGSAATVWKQWEYQFMGRGLTSSPYNSVQYFYWAETSAWGNRLEENNPMQWNVVKLNLPGCDWPWVDTTSLGCTVAFPLLLFLWKPEKMIRSTIISPWHHVYWGSMSDRSSAQMRSVSSNYSAVERLYRAVQSLLCIVLNRLRQLWLRHQSWFEQNNVHVYEYQPSWQCHRANWFPCSKRYGWFVWRLCMLS